MAKNKKKKNNNIISSIILLIICVFLIIGIIFIGKKYLSDNKDNTVNIVLNEGNLTINYIDGSNFSFNDNKDHSYSISITNTGNEKIYYSLAIESLITNKDLNIYVYDENNNEIFSDSKINKDAILLSLLEINEQETVRYKIVFKGGKKANVDGQFRVNNDSITTQTFSDIILVNNDVKEAKTKVGQEVAIDNEGLISTNDNKGLAYYFRGNVDNNYVKINDLMFRIVRINGDSTVRLVLDGVAKNKVAYNTNSLEEGQEAKTLADFSKSTIVNELNAWLESNLSNYNEQIVEEDYCIETEFNILNNGFYRTSTYTRVVVDNNPSITCSGGIYTGKVGLLSTDEVVLAGSLKDNENKSYYLYNSNISGSYILSTPNYINESNVVVMMSVKEDGSLEEGYLATDLLNMRPVINLGVSTKVKGKGTIDNPYIIVS